MLSAHWVWHLNIIDVFWLRSNILPSICIAELELVPLPNHSNERVAYAFFDKVLNMFGAPAKVLINQSTKFHGEFQGLCEKTFINHCMTSRNHLEVDGLVERMVQTMKWGLWKYDLHKGHIRDWDLWLPWLAMGYRFSWQAFLSSFSSYFLLFDCEHELPTSIRQDVMVIVNMDDLNMWIQPCEQWATLSQRAMSIALENLAMAQQ